MSGGTERRVQLLKVISRIPVEERHAFCRALLPLISHGISDNNVGEKGIATHLASVPMGERKELSELAVTLCEGLPSLTEREAIVKAISRVPADQRSTITQLASPYLTPLMNGSTRGYLVTIVSHLLPPTITLLQKLKQPDRPYQTFEWRSWAIGFRIRMCAKLSRTILNNVCFHLWILNRRIS